MSHLIYHYTGCIVAFAGSVIAQASTNAQAQGAGIVTSVCALIAILVPAWLADRKDKREKDTRLFQILQENENIKREAQRAKAEAAEAKIKADKIEKESSRIHQRMDRYDVTKVQIDTNTEKIGINKHKSDLSADVLFKLGYLRKPTEMPKTIKVLIVEDNIDLAKAITKTLVSHDFVVDYANTIEQGLKELENPNIFDWVLLDLNLDDGKGETIVQYIHEHKIKTRIALTTGSTDESRLSAIKANKIFRKPFDLKDLIKTLSYMEVKE